MKKLVICALSVTLMAVATLCPVAFAAEQPIRVSVDGMELDFDAQPRIVNDRTLVPLRGIFEAMGATVIWNGDTQTITALRLDSVVKLAVGGTDAQVDKEKRQMDVPAQLFEGRTFVPLRFISESMGAEVNWDSASRTATITTDKKHWSDPGDNLSANLLFNSKWVDMKTGEEMTFDPEQFIEISDRWDNNPEGLFYSYSETNEAEMNIVGLFMDGGHLKDHYLEFDPETRILSEYMFDDVLTSWHIAAQVEDEEASLIAAHDDVVGDFSYVDKEYRLILYYPNVFAEKPEDEDAPVKRFPSSKDNSVLQYWVIQNIYEETIDSFVENSSADEIAIYNNVVIGWNNDLDQETGEITPTAYFWVVEEDWIACAAISCETEKQAAEWCEKMVEYTAILIDRY